MVLTQIVTCEDVRLALNGTTGSSATTYQFWSQEISSGSVLAQINLSHIFINGLLGTTKMASTDDTTFYHLRATELDYAAMRVLVLLSGDVITDGFSITAGITIQNPLLLATYRQLVADFKEQAQLHLRLIQPLAVSADSDIPSVRDTAPSYF